MKYKLAIVASHPIQYQSPLWKFLAERPELDVTVYYCWDFGVHKPGLDKELGVEYKWDRPLLAGYKYVFLKNWSPKPAPSFWGQINPGIISELAKGKYDAVLVHGYVTLTSWLIFLSRFYTKAKIILRGEANLTGKNLQGIKANLKTIILTNLFKTIPAFLWSYRLNKEFYACYGVPENKLFFFPCAVDNEFFGGRAEDLKFQKVELRKKLGLKKPETFTFLFVGKLMRRKRPQDLLHAALILRPSASNGINLLIVGDGDERYRLERYAADRKLSDIYFFGFRNQSELPDFYAAADALILPSELDPSPKQVNEAMNFGLPILASDGVGTAPDLIVETGAGIMHKTGDVRELAENMKKLILDGKLLQKMSAASLRAVQEWSYTKDAEGFLAALEVIK